MVHNKEKPMRGFAYAIALSFVFGTSFAADGQNKVFNEVCAECHEVGDFSGDDPNEVAKSIGEIVAGKLKHKQKFEVSTDEALELALILVDDNP